MFEVALGFLNQLVTCIPFFIGLYILFDFVGCILFGKR